MLSHDQLHSNCKGLGELRRESYPLAVAGADTASVIQSAAGVDPRALVVLPARTRRFRSRWTALVYAVGAYAGHGALAESPSCAISELASPLGLTTPLNFGERAPASAHVRL